MKRRITNRLFRQVAAMRQLAAQINRYVHKNFKEYEIGGNYN